MNTHSSLPEALPCNAQTGPARWLQGGRGAMQRLHGVIALLQRNERLIGLAGLVLAQVLVVLLWSVMSEHVANAQRQRDNKASAAEHKRRCESMADERGMRARCGLAGQPLNASRPSLG